MTEIRTDIKITAKPVGFKDVQKASETLAKSAAQAVASQTKGFTALQTGAKGAAKEIDKLQGTLKTLAKEQLRLNEAMEAVGDKGTAGYKKLKDELKGVEQQFRQVATLQNNLDRAFKVSERTAKRQGFGQGLMQGLAPSVGTFLERGPGMRQQMIGQGIGAGIRGGVGAAGRVGAGLGGTAFTGAQSVVTALQAIPVVGGALAAPIARGLEQAQQTIQYEQMKLQTAPMLGGLGMHRAAVAAGRRGRAQAGGEADKVYASIMGITKTSEFASRYRPGEPEGPTSAAIGGAIESVTGLKRGFPGMITGQAAQAAEVKRMQGFAERGRDQALSAGERRARARAERGYLGDIAGQGINLMGTGLPETRQFLAGVTGAGGGTGKELRTEGMGETAMAAKTLFGIEAGTSGAFLGGGFRGGLRGAQGRSGEELTAAIGDALKAGLEGSEITEYVQNIAEGIDEWHRTGIQFNRETLASMVMAFGDKGLGAERGAAMAHQFRGMSMGISQQGPQSVAGLMMLQSMMPGGKKVGEGNQEDIEDAMIALEQGKFGGEHAQAIIQKLVAAGGGGAEGRRVAYGALRKEGVQMSREEMKLLSGGQLSDDQQKRLTQIQESRAAGGAEAADMMAPGGLTAAAAGMVPGMLKSQATLQNEQITAGANMVATMLTLEHTAQSVTTAITATAKPLLEKFSLDMKALTNAVIGNTVSRTGGAVPVVGPTDG